MTIQNYYHSHITKLKVHLNVETELKSFKIFRRDHKNLLRLKVLKFINLLGT